MLCRFPLPNFSGSFTHSADASTDELERNCVMMAGPASLVGCDRDAHVGQL